MTRRRSRIRQEINKIIYTGRGKDYRIVYLDRTREYGARLRELSFKRIRKVTEWALYLDDDETVIPLHRVVEIRDERGRSVWRRSGEQDTRS